MSSRLSTVKLGLWGTLGFQFLRLVLWSVRLSEEPPVGLNDDFDEDDAHPLQAMTDAESAEVLAIAARLMRAAKSFSAVGRVETPDCAESFFGFLSRNRAGGAGAPVSSFPEECFPTLIELTLLPPGHPGEFQRNRLQQLTSATCSIREALSSALRIPLVERFAWRPHARATDADVDCALLSLGLATLARPPAPAASTLRAPAPDGATASVVPSDEASAGEKRRRFEEELPVTLSKLLATVPVDASSSSTSARLGAFSGKSVSHWHHGAADAIKHSDFFRGSPVLQAAAESLTAGRHSMVPVSLLC